MTDQPTYPTILPPAVEAEIGPLEEPAPPVDPVFAEWWKNRWADDSRPDSSLEVYVMQTVALSAWHARDGKIAELEAREAHWRAEVSRLHAQADHTKDSVACALNRAVVYGGVKGERHKAWVIDQMVRCLTGEKYDALVARAKSGDKGPETYTWDCGVKP
jgi:hypothetical protein